MADQKTFEEDILPFTGSLFALAWRTTGNSTDAEDLVQDTLLRAYKGYGSFQAGTNLRAWLMRIMTNTYISAYRKRRRAPAQVDVEQNDLEEKFGDDSEQYAPTGFTTSAERVALDRIVDTEIQDALDQVPEKNRLPVILSALGFSYLEMADILKIPLGTVMSRLHRGRKMLSDSLSDYVQSHHLVADTAQTTANNED